MADTACRNGAQPQSNTKQRLVNDVHIHFLSYLHAGIVNLGDARFSKHLDKLVIVNQIV